MYQLIFLFWNICRLRARPEEIPYSTNLLWILVFFNILLGWGQLVIQEIAIEALFHSVILIGFALFFTVAVLQFKQMGSRVVQTLSAIMGTGLILSILITPLLVSQHYLIQMTQPFPLWAHVLSSITVILMLGVNVWILIITAHIFRHALDTRFAIGMLVTIALVGFNILLYSMLT